MPENDPTDVRKADTRTLKLVGALQAQKKLVDVFHVEANTQPNIAYKCSHLKNGSEYLRNCQVHG